MDPLQARSKALDWGYEDLLHKWSPQDIIEPTKGVRVEVPTEAQAVIHQTASRLLEELSSDFMLIPHASHSQPGLTNDLDQIDHDMRRMRSAMLAIKYEFGRRIALSASRRNSLGWFGQLSAELVGIILEHSLDDDTTNERLQELSSVSSKWWCVVKATPALWTTIDNFDDPEGMSLRLRKSGTLPIIVSNSAGGEFQQFINLVVPHAHRWSSASILTDKGEDVCGKLNGPLPFMKSFHLNCEAHASKPFRVDLRTADRFRDLNLIGAILHPDGQGLKTLHHLSFGDVQGVHLLEVLAIINSTTVLNSLNVHFVEEGRGESNLAELPGRVHLPALKSSRLMGMDASFADSIMRGIDADGLVSLTVDAITGTAQGSIFHQLISPQGHQDSILSKVAANAGITVIHLRIEQEFSLEIIAGGVEKGGDVWVRLQGANWTEYISNMDTAPGFASNLPAVDLTLSDHARIAAATAWKLRFLLSMPTVVSIKIKSGGTVLEQLLKDILGRVHQSNGRRFWACPKLESIRVMDVGVSKDWEAFRAAMQGVMDERKRAEMTDHLPHIVIERQLGAYSLRRHMTGTEWVDVPL